MGLGVRETGRINLRPKQQPHLDVGIRQAAFVFAEQAAGLVNVRAQLVHGALAVNAKLADGIRSRHGLGLRAFQ